MRRFLVIGLVCLFASAALAQGRISGTWSCPKPPAATTHSYAAGDKPNHNYNLVQFKCTASKGEIAGVKEKEGSGVEFSETTGNNAANHGVFTETMANGDHVTYKYTGSAVSKNGNLVSGANKFDLSGTGKFKDLKGSGTCSGKGNKDGSSTWTCTGTYTGVK